MAACSGGADPRAAELWLPLELPRGLLLLWRLGRWGGVEAAMGTGTGPSHPLGRGPAPKRIRSYARSRAR